MRSTTLALSLVAGSALFAGCANPPTQAVDEARSAMQAAQTAQAPDYAPEVWSSATDLENKLAAEMTAQENRFPLWRSYTTAQALAAQVKEEADRAASDAVAAKEVAKGEAETLMARAREEYENVKKALASAPKGKGAAADLASLQSDTGGIEASLQEMQRAFDSGFYLDAKAKAEAAITAAERIKSEIESARSMRKSAQDA